MSFARPIEPPSIESEAPFEALMHAAKARAGQQ
jgi:hypothetical protein